MTPKERAELLAKLEDALQHISGYASVAASNGLPLTLGNDTIGYSILDHARDEVEAVHAALEEYAECECDGGILWPQGSNSDFSHNWIERCDNCQKYEGDDEAADALAKRLGVSVLYAKPTGSDYKQPFIDIAEKHS